MAIHHATRARAEKIGVILTENEDGSVTAFWPERGVRLSAISAKNAVEDIIARQNAIREADARPASFLDGAKVHPDYVEAAVNHPLIGAALDLLHDEQPPLNRQIELARRLEGAYIDDNAIARSVDGVALDGAVAYSEGVLTADCPFNPEDEAQQEWADEWYTAWDEAADAKSEEEEETRTGSVVSEKYRAKYAEAGHPEHCGDWLAELLNGLCKNDAGTNLDLFTEICGMNGVKLGHLKLEKPSDRGRYRMTGRNMLARRVFLDEKLILPEALGGVKTPPPEWMAMVAPRYKKSKKGA